MMPKGPFIVAGWFFDDPTEIEIEKDDFFEAMNLAERMLEEGGYADVTDSEGNTYDVII